MIYYLCMWSTICFHFLPHLPHPFPHSWAVLSFPSQIPIVTWTQDLISWLQRLLLLFPVPSVWIAVPALECLIHSLLWDLIEIHRASLPWPTTSSYLGESPLCSLDSLMLPSEPLSDYINHIPGCLPACYQHHQTLGDLRSMTTSSC